MCMQPSGFPFLHLGLENLYLTVYESKDFEIWIIGRDLPTRRTGLVMDRKE